MRLNTTKKTNQSGFTLVELLIVIIIIGILAAIAFVAYSGAQNSANAGAAKSTLAEASSKLAEYNSDFGYYPAAQSGGSTSTVPESFDVWLSSPAGGNNTTMAGTYTTANGYTYTATGCTAGVSCTGYTQTAAANIAGGTAITTGN